MELAPRKVARHGRTEVTIPRRQELRMSRTDVTVLTEDGSCAATLHTPSSRGSWPAVILYPDAGGVRETFATMADRLAGLGYAVLLPDIYYRTAGRPDFADCGRALSGPGRRCSVVPRRATRRHGRP